MQHTLQTIVYLRGDDECYATKDTKVILSLLPACYVLAFNKTANILGVSLDGKVILETRISPTEAAFFSLLYDALPAFLPDERIWNLELVRKRTVPLLREKLSGLYPTLTIIRLQGRGYMLCTESDQR